MQQTTKTALKARCKEILHNTPINTLILGDNFDFLCNVFAMHPEAKNKLQSGVSKICIVERMGSKCFYFQRNDGQKDDISYRYSIDGYGTIKAQIIKAMRTTIAPIIQNFRNSLEWGKIRCCITNEVLYPENTHIDHYNKTFKELTEIWLYGRDLQQLYESLTECQLGYVLPELIGKDFTEFHNANTTLRPVTIFANLKIIK